MLARVFDFFSEMVPRISALRESGIPHSYFFDRGISPMSGIHVLTKWLEAAIDAGVVRADSSESVATAMLGALTARAFTAHWMHHAYSSRSNREYLKDITQLFCRALSVPAPSRRRRRARPRSNRKPPESS